MRIYHDYRLWEEVKHNMWGDAKDNALKEAIELISNHKLYGFFMMRVANEWKYSCENALTDQSLNKKAWIGHAAVALAIGCPEDITRKAWGYLTDEQRILANEEARRAIRHWEHSRKEDPRVCTGLVQKMLWE